MAQTTSKKLIVIKPNGNHSNRLLQNLYFEVFCIEHNIAYANPTFNDMAHLYVDPCDVQTNVFFKFLQIDLLGKLFRHSRVVKKIFSVVWILSKLGILKFVRFDNENELNGVEAKLLKAFEKHDVVYVAGWWFRALELSQKYKDEMSQRYSLKFELHDDRLLVSRVNDYKLNAYVVVGIHIRRGDYKTWKGGMYYYDDDVYRNQMQDITKQLIAKGHDKHVFVIFSNDAVSFNRIENILVSHEEWFVDHHLMCMCDYLIGPPSTFTLWASYLGGVDLTYLYRANQNIELK